jgi:hypothetical protein
MNVLSLTSKDFSARWILGAFMLLAMLILVAPRAAGQTSCTPLIPDPAFSPVLDINGTTFTTFDGGTGRSRIGLDADCVAKPG